MKKIVIGFLALALMLGTTAFALTEKQKAPLNKFWYQLKINGDPADYLDYTRVPNQPCNGSSSDICGVFAEQYSISDFDHPNLTQILTTVYRP